MKNECSRCGFDLSPRAEKGRKPQDRSFWPPIPPGEIEAKINTLCGCGGRLDCECVSVFNKARGDAWYEYNTTPR